MSYFSIKNLTVKHQEHTLVNIAFDVHSSTALIGQSGSGKSLTLKSILNLLPSNLNSSLDYESDFVVDHNSIGFVPQNPFTSLSPLTKIGKQFFCDEKTKTKVLQLVGLDTWVLNRFSSQLSGGQLQRVVLAIALSNNPKILLLDEPTTALDTQSKELILQLLQKIQKELDLLILYVTHDLDSVNELCNDIVIIKNGIVVEQGKVNQTIQNPQHNYTKELLEASFNNKEFRK